MHLGANSRKIWHFAALLMLVLDREVLIHNIINQLVLILVLVVDLDEFEQLVRAHLVVVKLHHIYLLLLLLSTLFSLFRLLTLGTFLGLCSLFLRF